ncbi:RNA/RNP complex-1-interacting phosphatase-like [Chaetodon trifascialis]|uniref:RNA/RNP complex-1-interacting phosphatase-like n=1 Tax=Chaetodon trifascialis TaxID=109706 RepID=UPI00399182DA
MPHDKKKKKKKSDVPEGWLDYRPVGQRIPGTRFIAFKVPLKLSLNRRVSDSDAFGFWDLLDYLESQNQELGLIIDLTFTMTYYQLTDVPQSCSYIKIRTEGHRVPSDATILSFKRAVRWFLKENRDNDKLIGVHCTHGLNRTGYLICRYLMDVDGLDAPAALELFNSSRGHCIERRNYLKDLQQGASRSNSSIDEPEKEVARGLAVERPPQTASGREETRPSGGNLAEELQQVTMNDHLVTAVTSECDVAGGQIRRQTLGPYRPPPYTSFNPHPTPALAITLPEAVRCDS